MRGSITLWQRDDIGSEDWHKTAAAAMYDYFADELLKMLAETF